MMLGLVMLRQHWNQDYFGIKMILLLPISAWLLTLCNLCSRDQPGQTQLWW
jgi:hypothetical protein